MPAILTALAFPERFTGPHLWWLVGAALLVVAAWGWLALNGARTSQRPRAR